MLYNKREEIEKSLTPEIVLKQFITFLIPLPYVKSHWLFFYALRNDLKVYLAIKEQSFIDSEFNTFMHNFVINYIYYKLYTFIATPNANPLFNSYHFQTLERTLLNDKYYTRIMQKDYPGYYWFYKCFFSLKLHLQGRLLPGKKAMWEAVAVKYAGLKIYLPFFSPIAEGDESFSKNLAYISTRISQALYHRTLFYEYRFGKIRLRNRN